MTSAGIPWPELSAECGDSPAERAIEHPHRNNQQEQPELREHRNAFVLAAIPAVAFVLGVSFFRNAPGAIQASFYVVYLGDIGIDRYFSYFITKQVKKAPYPVSRFAASE